MAWWSWCIFGVVLLGVELFAVDAQFYLVFAGLAAIVVGLLGPRRHRFAGRGRSGCRSRCSQSRRCSRVRRPIYAKLMNKPCRQRQTPTSTSASS